MPRSASSRAAPMGAMDIFDPAESVRLKAVTEPRSDSAFANRGTSPVPFGGFSSHVTANSPELRISDSLLMLRPSPCLDRLRAYPTTPAARYVIQAQAKCSIAR